MEIHHLVRGQPPQRMEFLEAMPDEGFVWLDFIRGTEAGLEALLLRVLGAELDPRHVVDSRDGEHKSFFDVSHSYDLLVFEEIAPQHERFQLETRSVALFIFDRLLVSIRSEDNISFGLVRQRFENGSTRSPQNVRVLVEILLDRMAERLLTVGEAFNQRLEDLQRNLLDPTSPFKDWSQLLDGRRDAYRTEWLCRNQLKVLERWHRQSNFEWSNPEETRLHDIAEHITLLRDACADLERHIEAAVQIHFASTAHRTNEIVRTLTVFSAIFLPLTFLAGVYGMNFVVMPELHMSFGYPAVLIVMILVVVLLLRHFRRRGFL